MEKAENLKSVKEINEKIKSGDVVVLTAEEIVKYVESSGVETAVKEVDVVTTGTFGAMCSSGVFLNFGHGDPPIKMTRVWLNDVEAFTGLAAVDAYLGATQPSETRGIEYGGGHVIEDLVKGKEVELRAVGYGTDCYPARVIETSITIHDLNQAIMVNPRNCYQRYNAAVNSSDKEIYTYMGVLKPNLGNVNYSGAGQLNPLCNDPDYETIGIGTRIFVAGAKGYIVGEGTQHNPEAGMATLMIRADLKEVDPRFIKGATIYKYGCTLFIGIGVPIPILNERILRKTLVTDRDIKVDIVDYGVPRRERPVIKVTTYAELRSGKVEVNGVDVPAYPVSSYKLAREVAEELKRLIEKGEFYLTEPVERLPRVKFRPMAKKPIRRKTTWPKPRPFKGLVLDQEACIHCGYCIPVCPTGALSISNEDYTVRLDVSRCNLCGKCVDVCPVNALKLVG